MRERERAHCVMGLLGGERESADGRAGERLAVEKVSLRVCTTMNNADAGDFTGDVTVQICRTCGSVFLFCFRLIYIYIYREGWHREGWVGAGFA